METFRFVEPAFAFGFGDPGVEVVPNLFEVWPFSGVHDENGTAHTPLTERTVDIEQFRGQMRPAVATVTGRDARCPRAGSGDVGGSSRRRCR